ncbi:uncharacterized protein BDV17DRAFT_82564 [Aspergillus undulatus]|uniref:uncharacterized protein n=1 Tax=Aspergillus undulatus TaxID=1810928 RepID=UPI003CCE1DE3
MCIRASDKQPFLTPDAWLAGHLALSRWASARTSFFVWSLESHIGAQDSIPWFHTQLRFTPTLLYFPTSFSAWRTGFWRSLEIH